MTERQRILGIDPGSRLTGFGVLDCASNCATYVASGAVRTGEGAFPERLRMIFHSIREIVEEYQPDVVAIESVFMHRNAGSALKLGQARSAAICATFGFALEIHEYAPREIKQAIVGTGAATKDQVLHMVRSLLELDGNPSPDAADALATALCYAHQRRLHLKVSSSAAIVGLQ
ncbi:MAG: crossover junction endodeoxyribonuclease RuvC [Gammaproteobacteria bacterium]|nr:MAG: crossover junction endodeoxyribonuclease RuvC [Gammaproteobacteria bacterium]